MIKLRELVLYSVGIGLLYFVYRVFRQWIYWPIRRVPCSKVPFVYGLAKAILGPKKPLVESMKILYNLYPKARYFGFCDFMGPTLMIRDPELIREIGIKAFDSFPGHQMFFDSENDILMRNNLVFLRDQKWKNMRNLLSPSFTASKMKLMFGLIDDCAREFVQCLAGEFDAKDAFTKYTCDVIATAAFGLQVNTMENPDNEFYKAGMDVSNQDLSKVFRIFLVNKIPILRDMFPASMVSPSTTRFFTDLIENTISERKERGIVRPDMIQLMMEAAEKENGFDITMDEMVAQSFIFFLGGFETSSNFMCVVTFELAGNPEVQERLRQEVDQFFQDKKDEKVTYDEVNKLKYLDMVLSETLRIHPPAIVTDRLCSKEYQLPSPLEGYPGYKVEPGVLCYLSMIGLHHDPIYYPEPEKFDPERFSDERKHEINPYAYIPFGVGPRRCIGDRFALMETKILVIYLVKKFVIKLSEKTKYPIVYDTSKLAILAKGGFHLKLEERKKIE